MPILNMIILLVIHLVCGPLRNIIRSCPHKFGYSTSLGTGAEDFYLPVHKNWVIKLLSDRSGTLLVAARINLVILCVTHLVCGLMGNIIGSLPI